MTRPILLPVVIAATLAFSAATPATDVDVENDPGSAVAMPVPAPDGLDRAETLYHEMRLAGTVAYDAFLSALRSAESHGFEARVLAIADMSLASTEQRLTVVDLATRQLLLQTFVAHGSGSGELMAERFSNVEGSHQTSLGLYRVGSEIVSPKHGPALLLEGLDPGVNDRARAREIIVHGADYVSADFIAQNGRLGRSWGCPAVPRDQMARVIELLSGGGLLFIHGA